MPGFCGRLSVDADFTRENEALRKFTTFREPAQDDKLIESYMPIARPAL